MSSTPSFRVEHLTIATPDSVLLENINFALYPGEVVLLMGGIGSGKSTLLKLLAGLISVRNRRLSIEGDLIVGEQRLDLARARQTLGGYVFQNHAMFDELSARDNVAIARDHARFAQAPPPHLGNTLMAEFAHDERQAHQYSGGQQQSIAITRTLFSGHLAMFYDEPNSGLDPHQTQELAALIKTIATETTYPAIVVAHHIQHLLPQVDRVLAIDSQSKQLIALPSEEQAIAQFFQPPTAAPTKTTSEVNVIDSKPGLRLRWAARYFTHYFVTLLFSPTMILYMVLCGLLTGFVSTWFLFQHFPYSNYLGPLLHDQTIETLGFVQFRILVPLLTALLIASRNSAIISADLGHRVYSQQIDAMTNLQIPYHRYLSASIIMNMVLASVLFVIFNFMLAAFASMITWRFLHELQSVTIWKTAFYDSILPLGSSTPIGGSWVLGKMIASGAVIGLISTLSGMVRKATVLDLNRGIARAIILSTAAILMIHAVSALMEF